MTAAAYILTAALLIVAMLTPSPDWRDLPPCPTEDSSDCYWDASTQGNGRGTSFYDIGGTLHPLTD